MKANEDKHIEKLIDHIMKDQTLESPSFDFTSKIMSQVIATKTSNVTVYKPLISKSVLIGIIAGIIALVSYGILYGNPKPSRWTNSFYFILLYNINFSDSFHMSKTATYSIVLTSLFLLIQISFLKNYFDKKYE